MISLVTANKSAHWYTREGKPMHTVIGANGKERSATLRDARGLGLFPSVTSILDVIAKPGLVAWQVEQGIMASLTLPHAPDEPLDAFAQRVVIDMEAHRDNAAALGTRIHSAIDQVLNGFMPDPEMSPYLAEAGKWFDAVGLSPRLVEADMVSREWGFGGRMDLYAEVNGIPAVIDFKTQDVKKGKPKFYESWPLQLAAYRHMLREAGHPVEKCYSIVVDVNKGQPVHVKEWSADELDFVTFTATFALWKYLKGYQPLGKLETA
jgi:hypothetical protein